MTQPDNLEFEEIAGEDEEVTYFEENDDPETLIGEEIEYDLDKED